MNGWIKIHRKLTEWEWYDDIPTKVLFLHLLLRANHKPKGWHGIEIKTGEVLSGRKKLAQETRLSERQVRTALNHLKSTNELTIKSTKQYSIYKLNNWNIHQLSDHQTDQRPTNDRPTTDQRPTTNNNEKNEKNEKKLSPTKKIEKVFLDLSELQARGISYSNPAFQKKYGIEKGSNLPKEILKNCETWAQDIEKLHRIDKADLEEIEAMIQWLYHGGKKNSDFWKKNIQSGATLRRQWQKLVMAMREDLKEHKSNQIPDFSEL